MNQVSNKLSREAQEGRYVFDDGSIYEGELVMGLPDGFGTIELASGDLYEGQSLKANPQSVMGLSVIKGSWFGKYSGNWEKR